MVTTTSQASQLAESVRRFFRQPRRRKCVQQSNPLAGGHKGELDGRTRSVSSEGMNELPVEHASKNRATRSTPRRLRRNGHDRIRVNHRGPVTNRISKQLSASGPPPAGLGTSSGAHKPLTFGWGKKVRRSRQSGTKWIMTEITVRVLDGFEWSVYRDVRLRTLADSPARSPRPWPRKLIVTTHNRMTRSHRLLAERGR